MQIPRSWASAAGECESPDHRKFRFAVWGWGADDAIAKREAASRLRRLMERIRRGEPFPSVYQYGSRPLREEILQTFDEGVEGQAYAVLTRNRYGALVLNTSRLLFLDIDLPPESFTQRIRSLFFSGPSGTEEAALAKLRGALRLFGRATFRLYRTAAGFRALAIDREFDPAGRDVQDLMKNTGTDPAFMRLCLAQKSFRARLTPKPWRCHCPPPPGTHPRVDDAARQRFTAWVSQYERASDNYATCRHIETIGSGGLRAAAEKLVVLHDKVTRCGEALPLA